MRAVLDEARALKAIAAIRSLQRGEARLASARADGERQAAEERLEDARAAVQAVERDWAAAVAGAGFDPALSGSWLHAAEACRDDERLKDEAAVRAGEEAALRHRGLMEAQARLDVSESQARAAARRVTRQREEAQLAAVEDRINGGRRRP